MARRSQSDDAGIFGLRDREDEEEEFMSLGGPAKPKRQSRKKTELDKLLEGQEVLPEARQSRGTPASSGSSKGKSNREAGFKDVESFFAGDDIRQSKGTSQREADSRVAEDFFEGRDGSLFSKGEPAPIPRQSREEEPGPRAISRGKPASVPDERRDNFLESILADAAAGDFNLEGPPGTDDSRIVMAGEDAKLDPVDAKKIMREQVAKDSKEEREERKKLLKELRDVPVSKEDKAAFSALKAAGELDRSDEDEDDKGVFGKFDKDTAILIAGMLENFAKRRRNAELLDAPLRVSGFDPGAPARAAKLSEAQPTGLQIVPAIAKFRAQQQARDERDRREDLLREIFLDRKGGKSATA